MRDCVLLWLASMAIVVAIGVRSDAEEEQSLSADNQTQATTGPDDDVAVDETIERDRSKPIASETERQPTANQIRELNSLSSQAAREQSNGNVDTATELTRQLVDKTCEYCSSDDERYRYYAQRLIALYAQQEQFEQAHDELAGWLDWHDRVYGPDHWQTKSAGNYNEYIELLEDLTREERAELFESDRLHGVASQLAAQRRFLEAIEIQKRCVAIKQRILGDNDLRLAIALNNLGIYHAHVGDLNALKEASEWQLRIVEDQLGRSHPMYAECHIGLALVCTRLGDERGAERHYTIALTTREVVFGAESLAYVATLVDLANTNTHQSDLAHAVALYRAALDTLRRNANASQPGYSHREQYLRATSGLASTLRLMGDAQQARDLAEESFGIAKRIRKSDPELYLTTASDLASALADCGERDRAEELYLHIIECEQADRFTNQLHHASSLRNMGSFYADQKDYELALEFLERGQEITRATAGTTHPGYASGLLNIARVYLKQGRLIDAELTNRRALSLLGETNGEHHPAYITLLGNQAAILSAQGRLLEAWSYHDQEIRLFEDSLAQTASITTSRQKFAQAATFQFRYSNYLNLLRVFDRGDLLEAALLRKKGRILQWQRAMQALASDPKLKDEFIAYRDATRQWATLVTQRQSAGKLDKAQQGRIDRTIAALRDRKLRHELALASKSAELADARREIGVEALLDRLPRESALIDSIEIDVDGGRSLLAVVLRKEATPRIVELGQSQEIERALDAWAPYRRHEPAEREKTRAAAVHLRRLVWDPLLPVIGDATTVLVSPDGVLARIPLGALPAEDGESYLIEDYTFATVPVPRMLVAAAAGRTADEHRSRLLVMGAIDYDRQAPLYPDFDEDAPSPGRLAAASPSSEREAVRGPAQGLSWPELSATAGEADFVTQRLTEWDVVSRDAVIDRRGSFATESAFRSWAPKSTYVHLATHAFFSPADDVTREATGAARIQPSPGLQSGLVFAGANEPPSLVDWVSQTDSPNELVAVDDGVLYADEIASLPLHGVELVVLSACETGLGPVAGGEGLMGIQRAFQAAGAKTTVATLWKVNDKATAALMQRFYANLFEQEMSEVDALRAAQLWALRNPDAIKRAIATRSFGPVPASDPPDDNAAGDRSQRTAPRLWAAFMISISSLDTLNP